MNRVKYTMKKEKNSNKVTNYNTFNITLQNTPNGLKVLRAFAVENEKSNSPTLKRVNSRNLARVINKSKFVTH